MSKALILLKNPEFHPDAKKQIESIENLADQAFNKVKSFENKVNCKRIAIFARLLTLTIDKKSQTDETRRTIAEIVFKEMEAVIAEFKNLEIPSTP